MSKIYIVVGSWCWGTAGTIKKAKKNCLDNFPRVDSTVKKSKTKIFIYEVSECAYVNDMGGINYSKNGFACAVNEDGVRMEGKLGVIEPA